MAKWHADDPADFTCDSDGKLVDSLPSFFRDWFAKYNVSENGKPLLSDTLLREGRL